MASTKLRTFHTSLSDNPCISDFRLHTKPNSRGHLQARCDVVEYK